MGSQWGRAGGGGEKTAAGGENGGFAPDGGARAGTERTAGPEELEWEKDGGPGAEVLLRAPEVGGDEL